MMVKVRCGSTYGRYDDPRCTISNRRPTKVSPEIESLSYELEQVFGEVVEGIPQNTPTWPAQTKDEAWRGPTISRTEQYLVVVKSATDRVQSPESAMRELRWNGIELNGGRSDDDE